MSKAEAADLLRCSEQTIGRYALENGWTRVRPSRRHVLYLREEIEAFLTARTFVVTA